MTNYERIKAMSVEEMAVYIERSNPWHLSEKFCIQKKECCEDIDSIQESECVKCVIAWLECECDK